MASEPVTSPPSDEVLDRVELRNGGIVEGELVEIVPKSHITLIVSGTANSRTFNWGEVEYVQRAGEPREAVSAGKPSIAELAAESSRIDRKSSIGLGLVYGGYSTTSLALLSWVAYGFTQSRPLLVVSLGLTATSAGLLSGGAVLFFRARSERKELRKVILSVAPIPRGGLLGVGGRF